MPDSENSETTSIGEAFPHGLPVIYVKFIFAHLAVSFSKRRPRSSTSKPKSTLTHPSPVSDPSPSPLDINPVQLTQPLLIGWWNLGPRHTTDCLQLFDVVLFTNHEHIWVTQHVSQRLLPAQTDGDVNQALSASLCRWSHRRQQASGTCVLADGCCLPCVP